MSISLLRLLLFLDSLWAYEVFLCHIWNTTFRFQIIIQKQLSPSSTCWHLLLADYYMASSRCHTCSDNFGRLSLQCKDFAALQVAESYLDQDAFYFPHNLDFRGRAYPMHPNLNHLGADLSRGLLQFADAKPLGPDGLRWLEISVSLHHTLVH